MFKPVACEQNVSKKYFRIYFTLLSQILLHFVTPREKWKNNVDDKEEKISHLTLDLFITKSDRWNVVVSSKCMHWLAVIPIEFTLMSLIGGMYAFLKLVHESEVDEVFFINSINFSINCKLCTDFGVPF